MANIGYAYAESTEEDTDEMIYLSLEENPEIVKQRVSDAFWNNPINTPPMLVLIAVAGVGIIIAWRKKWYVHEKTSLNGNNHD